MSEQLVTPENVTTKDGKINLLDLNRQTDAGVFLKI